MGCFNSKSSKNSKVVSNAEGTLLRHQKTTKTLTKDESIINLFTLEQTLATHPYGTIVKATHISSKLIRAIKIINCKGNDSFTVSERHLRLEVDTLSKLDHPNILQVFDILHDGAKLYIVMEYWKGGLLFDKIKERGSLTEKLAGSIISQILSGVKYCHERKVIHRDLNPKVIFMMNTSGDPQIKIGEFGSSVFLDPEHKHEGKFDSCAYVAPEVVDEMYNEKCDIWSVGVIFHVLLTGRTPFTRELTEACEEAAKKKPLNVKVLEELGISPSAIELLKLMLCLNYHERISAAEALVHPWFNIVENNTEGVTRNLEEAMDHLKCYSSHSKVVDSIQAFIAKQVITHKDNKNLVEVFKSLDSDWDGKLSKPELLKYYSRVMPEVDAKELVNEIFDVADTDKSGFLEFSEFMKASLDKSNLVSKKNLEAAFKMLDCDNSGTISRKELQGVLDGTSLSGDKKWMKLLARADKNHDGEIDLKEFYDLLIEFH